MARVDAVREFLAGHQPHGIRAGGDGSRVLAIEIGAVLISVPPTAVGIVKRSSRPSGETSGQPTEYVAGSRGRRGDSPSGCSHRRLSEGFPK